MLWSGSVARAGIVTYDFVGTVNLVFGNPFNGISPSLSNAVTGSFSYDTSVVGTTTANHPGALSYAQAAPRIFSITLDGGSFHSVSSYDARISAGSTVVDCGFCQLSSPLRNLEKKKP